MIHLLPPTGAPADLVDCRFSNQPRRSKSMFIAPKAADPPLHARANESCYSKPQADTILHAGSEGDRPAFNEINVSYRPLPLATSATGPPRYLPIPLDHNCTWTSDISPSLTTCTNHFLLPSKTRSLEFLEWNGRGDRLGNREDTSFTRGQWDMNKNRCHTFLRPRQAVV